MRFLISDFSLNSQVLSSAFPMNRVAVRKAS